MQVIGIYKDKLSCKVACISRDRKLFHLDFLEKSEDKFELKHIFTKCATKKNSISVTGIDGQNILIRQMSTPIKKRSALQKITPFQLESLLPYSSDQAIVKPTFDRKGEKTIGTFFSVSNQAMDEHIRSFNEVGIDPEWVSCTPVALQRFGEFTSPSRSSYIIFYLGEEHTQIVSIINKNISSHLTLGMGLKDFYDAYRKDHPNEQGKNEIHLIRQLDLLHLDESLYGSLYAILERFKREVDRAFCFMQQKEVNGKLQDILFLGETEVSFLIEKYILETVATGFSSIKIDSFRGFDQEVIKPYAIPIGLCLDVLKRDKNSIQFRQGPFISKKSSAKIKKKIFFGLFLCLGLTITTFFSLQFLSGQKKKSLCNKVSSFISTYSDVIPSSNKIEEKENIDKKLEHISKDLRIQRNDFKHLLSPPLVTDLFAFIHSHPLLNRSKGDKKIEIKQFNYALLKYPTLESPLEPYKVKVELTIICPEPKWAREFHDQLCDDKKIINHAYEIEWNRNQDEYQIIFYINT